MESAVPQPPRNLPVRQGLVEQILQYGRTIRPALGITMAPAQVRVRMWGACKRACKHALSMEAGDGIASMDMPGVQCAADALSTARGVSGACRAATAMHEG